ncbi:MAG: tetratricopeptide repeat protein [Desulfobacterales bacterium]|nr:tetratricopeptide repeat protein [Desulfobacterales bacterium]MDD4070957.1 tetratricopeptide repeat protein [Desulfobacterales bacterium]MDD4393417.1 tetratricopeptide repeat protein [Desulfobacterales bacterium]
MARKTKISRKQLLKGPDEFLTFSSKLIRYAVEHKTAVLSVVIICICLLSVIVGYRHVTNRDENNAFALLQKATNRYQALVNEKGGPEAIADVAGDFQKIVDTYPGRYGGKFAKVALANINYNAGKIDEAAGLYRELLDQFSGISPSRELIISSLGYCSEAKGDLPAAITWFEMLANPDENSFMKNEALFHLGLLYEKTGKSDQSADAFKQIAAGAEGSLYFELAKEKANG